jgi:DNA repair protein RadC
MPRKLARPAPGLCDAIGAKAHYLGHRERLHERLLTSEGQGLPDYEILDILLAASNPRGDTFGGLAEVVNAHPDSIRDVKVEFDGNKRGLGTSGIAMLKAVREASLRLSKSELQHADVIGSWDKLIDYCKANIAHGTVEEFHLLFLNRKNALITHERQQRGTIDHTPVYTREVVKRALELNASALILVHNHPSGDPTPSKADIEVTRDIIKAAGPLGVIVHDHLIIGRGRHTSLPDMGLL